jgi:hypothetical protein
MAKTTKQGKMRRETSDKQCGSEKQESNFAYLEVFTFQTRKNDLSLEKNVI